MPKTKKVSRRSKVKNSLSVWEAMNEPIAYPSEEFGRHVAVVAVFIMAMAWLSPSLGHAEAKSYQQQAISSQRYAIGYEGVFGKYRDIQRPVMTANVFEVSAVLGASIENENMAIEADESIELTVGDLIMANAIEFSDAMYEVLDVSDPIMSASDFLEPGVNVVWNSWLDLMADPDFR